MSFPACDSCGTVNYIAERNPYVEVRVARPSDPSELVCILAGCNSCFPGSKTPAEYEEYFESGEAGRDGFAWLT